MESITLRLQPDTIESLSDEAEEHGVTRSEYVRNIIRSRHELQRLRGGYDELQEEYEAEIEQLEQEIERLQNEKRTLIEAREEHNELVEYVEQERSLQQRQEERRQANVFRRAWWWVAGEPDHESEGQ